MIINDLAKELRVTIAAIKVACEVGDLPVYIQGNFLYLKKKEIKKVKAMVTPPDGYMNRAQLARKANVKKMVIKSFIHRNKIINAISLVGVSVKEYYNPKQCEFILSYFSNSDDELVALIDFSKDSGLSRPTIRRLMIKTGIEPILLTKGKGHRIAITKAESKRILSMGIIQDGFLPINLILSKLEISRVYFSKLAGKLNIKPTYYTDNRIGYYSPEQVSQIKNLIYPEGLFSYQDVADKIKLSRNHVSDECVRSGIKPVSLGKYGVYLLDVNQVIQIIDNIDDKYLSPKRKELARIHFEGKSKVKIEKNIIGRYSASIKD